MWWTALAVAGGSLDLAVQAAVGTGTCHVVRIDPFDGAVRWVDAP